MFNTFIKFYFLIQMLITPVYATVAIIITLIIIATSLLESYMDCGDFQLTSLS